MKLIEVLAPGLFTTVQDLGRPGYGPIGVSASGAADPTGLRLANVLLGNPQNSAGLEMTLQGGQFLFPEGGVVALGGSDFGAEVDGQAIAPWTVYSIPAGRILKCGRSRSGARCYVCVRGGIRVPLILGSASTHILSGLGGFEGRALRRGDRLEIGPEPAGPARRSLHPDLMPLMTGHAVIRVTSGPQAEWFTEASVASFYASTYTVTADANRMGIRLSGAPLQLAITSELISEGVALGCVQAPAGGQPLILFVEQQTTGGYAKIANVIAADLPALGQLKPGDQIRFERVDLREARELLYIQERWINSPNACL
jgi:antagonist of KipI